MACWARFLVSGTRCLSWHRDMRITWSGHASIPPSTKSNMTWYRDIAVLLNIPVRCKKHKFLNEWTPAPSKAVALANLRSSKRPYFLYSYSLLCLIYKKWVIFQIPLVLSSREALKYSLFRRKLECCTSKALGRLLPKVHTAGTVSCRLFQREHGEILWLSQPLLCLCFHLGTRLTRLLKISTKNI